MHYTIGRNCTQQEHITAQEKVIHCLEESFNITQAQVNQSKHPKISPFNHDYNQYHHPCITLYANCDTCASQISIPYNNALIILHPGSLFTYIGLSLLIILLVIQSKTDEIIHAEHHHKRQGSAYESLFSVSNGLSRSKGIHV